MKMLAKGLLNDDWNKGSLNFSPPSLCYIEELKLIHLILAVARYYFIFIYSFLLC